MVLSEIIGETLNVLASPQNRLVLFTLPAQSSKGECKTLIVSYVAKKKRVVSLLSTAIRKVVTDRSNEKTSQMSSIFTTASKESTQ